jgi:hypothetical protein
MKSLVALCLILAALPANAASMSPQMGDLFDRVSDLTAVYSFVARELTAAYCADPQGYAQGQEKILEKISTLKTQEIDTLKKYNAAEDAWGSIAKTVLKKQLSISSYSIIMIEQRKAFTDRAMTKSCE